MAVPWFQGPVPGTNIGGGWMGVNATHTVNADQVSGGIFQQVPAEKYAVEQDLYVINGEAAPLTTLLTQQPMKRIVSHDTMYRWAQIRDLPERDTVAGSVAVGAVNAVGTMAVGNGAMWSQRDEFACLSPQCQGWVTAVAGNLVTFSWTHPPATPILPNAAVFRIASAYFQHDFPVSLPTTRPVEHHNFYQYVFNFVTISEMALNGNYQLPVGGRWQFVLDQKKREHTLELEKLNWFGQQVLNLAGNSPAGFMEGVYYRCATHRQSLANARLTRPVWDTYMAAFTRDRISGPNTVIRHFTGQRQIQQITGFSAGLDRYTAGGDKMFGLAVTRYKLATGETIELVQTKLFDFLGLYGLGVTIRFEPGALALVNHRTIPTPIQRKDVIIPWGGTMVMAGYRSLMTQMIKDEAGHLAVLENVGP